MPEHTHILRWEDDGGAIVETDNPLPQVVEINTPGSMDVDEECLLLEEQPSYVKIETTIKGELQ